MKKFFVGIIITMMALLAGSPVLLYAQSVEESVEAAQKSMDNWVAATNDFAGKVRFDEGDMKSFLANWKSLEETGEKMSEGEDDEDFVDFQSLLKDPRYTAWAKSRNVEGEEWLRKSVRIFSMVMGRKMVSAMAEAEKAAPGQMAAFEAQRAQMGEEMYGQMKEAVEASLAMTKQNKETWSKLPAPSKSEAALLEKYDGELTELIMADDEADRDEAGDYDDYDGREYGGEDDDEQ